MEFNPIQAEISRIEAEAARQTKQLLDHQDDYLAALQIVDTLKKGNPALENLQVHICYHSTKKPGFNVYGNHTSPAEICASLATADIEVTVEDGFDVQTSAWKVDGIACMKIFMPADLTPVLQKLPEAA